MNKKRIFLIVICTLLLLFLLFVYFNKKEVVEEQQTGSTPIVYKVTKEGSNNTIYLFGSIHIADKSAYPLPEYVMNAYKDSDYLAVEFDLVEFQKNPDAQLMMLQGMAYTDGSRITDHISLETYNKMVSYLKENSIYSNLYDVYKPYFFLSLIDDVIYKKAKLTSDGIDTYLLKMAKKDNKEILEVESFQEQFDLFLGFDDKLYELMIEDSIDNANEAVLTAKLLYNSWKNGDYDLLVKYSGVDEDNDEESILIEKYNNKLLYDRNLTMKDKLTEYFNTNKKVLFTVGAAHIVGNKGIAKLLEEEGYKVELIK